MKTYLLSRFLFASFLFIFLQTPLPVFSQVSLQWERLYGNSGKHNDMVRDMVVDDMGNVYVTGISDSANNKLDYVTAKYNSSGEQQWVARYDGVGGNDWAQAIAIDKSGNIYVTGYSETINGPEFCDFTTIKYNNAGTQQWVARFEDPFSITDYASAIKLDKDGNIYICGFVNGVSASDGALIKYNSSGVFQWVRYYNGSANSSDGFARMAIDSLTSDVYVTGTTTSTGSGEDYVTIKYSSSGDEQWVRTYDGGGIGDNGSLIVLDQQGNVIVSGNSRTPGNVYMCTTIKYSPSGSQQWVISDSGPGGFIFQPSGIVVDRYGNTYITGWTDNARYKSLYVTAKYNSQGVPQWTKFYESTGTSDGFGWNMSVAIALDSQDNVYVTGRCLFDNSVDCITIKYNSDGVQQWLQHYNVPNLHTEPSTIAVNKFNEVFIAGSLRTYPDIAADYYDYLILKYIQTTPLVVNAGPDTTVYYGYGSNCVQLKAEVSGGVAPFTFSWSPVGTTANNQTTTVCPTTSTVYTVIVKDAVGTTDTAQVSVKVIDVRCDKNKVIVCHNGKELCIPSQAVAAHLQHGDKLGSCSAQESDCDKLKNITSGNGRFPFIFKAYPNPFNHVSTLIYQLPLDAQVTITLLDLNGREIKTLVQEKKRAGYYLAFVDAKKLVPGSYICRMIISIHSCQSVHTLKLIVMK